MSYTHFTLEERKYLQQLLGEGLSFRKIAAVLERSPSTISREVNRNRAQYKPHRPTDNPFWYNHWRAQTLAVLRRRDQHRRALGPGTPQWEYIVDGLKKFWSPEAICGRWKLDHPEEKPLHFSTIYRYIAERPICADGENESCQGIRATIPSSRIGSSRNGRMKFVFVAGLATGRGTRFTEPLERTTGHISGQDDSACEDRPAAKPKR